MRIAALLLLPTLALAQPILGSGELKVLGVKLAARPSGAQSPAAPATATPPALVVALSAHRDHLRSVAARAEGAGDLITLLDSPPNDGISPADRVNTINGLSTMGTRALGPALMTGFIEDEVVTRVLGAGLLDPDAEVRDRACAQLEAYGRDLYLATIADEIEQAAPKLPVECGARLVGRLSVSKEEAAQMLGRPLSGEVRARLGDEAAEADAIAAFASASDFDGKERAAKILGYIGTPTAGAALVRSLHSPLIRGTGVGDRVSIRIPIILALNRIQQNEPLLFRSVMRISQVGDQVYGEEAVAAYLESVYAWAQANYHLAPEGPDPGAYLMDIATSPAAH